MTMLVQMSSSSADGGGKKQLKDKSGLNMVAHKSNAGSFINHTS